MMEHGPYTLKREEPVKNGGKVLAALALAVGVGKKYGPALLKNLSKLRKI